MRWLALTILLAPTLGAQHPTIFAPGFISNETASYAPAFAPDCRAVWYTMRNGVEDAIVTLRVEHGH